MVGCDNSLRIDMLTGDGRKLVHIGEDGIGDAEIEVLPTIGGNHWVVRRAGHSLPLYKRCEIKVLRTSY
jgi:hypothetical protein